jgi:hypothetical protein
MLQLLFSIWLSLSPLSFSDDQAIEKTVEIKQRAINQRDMELFMSTIYPDNHYLQEQKRWFHDAISFVDRGSFRLTVKHKQQLAKDRYRVDVVQTFLHNHHRYTAVYPLEMRKTANGWQDIDFLPYRISQGRISVRYNNPVHTDYAKQALTILTHVDQVLANKFYWHPKKLETKLYDNPALFRQSVKLSLPTWAGGWNEARESIKLIVEQADASWLKHGLAHEYTHQLLSDLTNDNAAYWLQEGTAMYYEALISRESPTISVNFRLYSISELEKLNLEQLQAKDATRYYLSCYVHVRNFIQRYGEDKLQQMLHMLRRYSYIDADSASKRLQTNQRTAAALQQITK